MKKALFNFTTYLGTGLYSLFSGLQSKRAPLPIDASAIKNILILKPDHLGDAILCTPALRAIKEAVPHATVWFSGKPWVLKILENNPHIDRLVPFDPQWPGQSNGTMPWAQIHSLAKELRKEQFSLSISFQDSPLNHLFPALCHIPIRVGYGPRGGSSLLTHCMEGPDEDHHETRIRLALIEAVFGKPALPDPPKIYLTETERASCTELLKNTLDISGRFIAFGTGAGNPGKEISVAKAIEITKGLVDSGLPVLLTGGPREAERLQSIQQAVASDLVKATSSLTVRELAGVLSRAEVFVGHDSGPSHVASAMGTPVISLWGPGNPRRWKPTGDRNHVVRHKKCDTPPKRPICYDCACLNAVSADEILSVIREIID